MLLCHLLVLLNNDFVRLHSCFPNPWSLFLDSWNILPSTPPPELTIDHAWSQEPLSQKPTCLIILVDTATLELFLPHSLNALDPPNLFQPLHLQ